MAVNSAYWWQLLCQGRWRLNKALKCHRADTNYPPGASPTLAVPRWVHISDDTPTIGAQQTTLLALPALPQPKAPAAPRCIWCELFPKHSWGSLGSPVFFCHERSDPSNTQNLKKIPSYFLCIDVHLIKSKSHQDRKKLNKNKKQKIKCMHAKLAQARYLFPVMDLLILFITFSTVHVKMCEQTLLALPEVFSDWNLWT